VGQAFQGDAIRAVLCAARMRRGQAIRQLPQLQFDVQVAPGRHLHVGPHLQAGPQAQGVTPVSVAPIAAIESESGPLTVVFI
jgi:hypothetical protein